MASKGKKGRSRGKKKRTGGTASKRTAAITAVEAPPSHDAAADDGSAAAQGEPTTTVVAEAAPESKAAAVGSGEPVGTAEPVGGAPPKPPKAKPKRSRQKKKAEPRPDAPPPPPPESDVEPRPSAPEPPAGVEPTAAPEHDVDVFDLDADLAATPGPAEPPVFDLDDEIDAGVPAALGEPAAESQATERPEAVEESVAAPHEETAREVAAAAVGAGEAADDEVEDLDVDLGPISTPEARARILAAALAHAEMQEARYRVPTVSRRAGRIKATLALVLLAMAGFIALAPPPLVVPTPLPTLTVQDRDHGTRLALLLQAQQIEAFRASEMRLPASLDELDASLPGVRFVRSSNRLYQLVAYTEDGRAIVYDSSAPAPEFAALSPSWAGRGGA